MHLKQLFIIIFRHYLSSDSIGLKLCNQAMKLHIFLSLPLSLAPSLSLYIYIYISTEYMK